jgi:hypothetical protein
VALHFVHASLSQEATGGRASGHKPPLAHIVASGLGRQEFKNDTEMIIANCPILSLYSKCKCLINCAAVSKSGNYLTSLRLIFSLLRGVLTVMCYKFQCLAVFGT